MLIYLACSWEGQFTMTKQQIIRKAVQSADTSFARREERAWQRWESAVANARAAVEQSWKVRVDVITRAARAECHLDRLYGLHA